MSGTSVESLCSVALLEVLVLVGSSGACSKVLPTTRMPFFPSSFSTSKNQQKNNKKISSHQLLSFRYVSLLFKITVVICTQLRKRDPDAEEHLAVRRARRGSACKTSTQHSDLS